MDNVINFPKVKPKGWFDFERALLALLASRGFSEAVITQIVKRMRLAYEEHQLEFDLNLKLPGRYAKQVSDCLGSFNHQLQIRTTQLLLKRLELEIRLAQVESQLLAQQKD